MAEHTLCVVIRGGGKIISDVLKSKFLSETFDILILMY